MISVLKSVWSVAGPTQQLKIIIVINITCMLCLFASYLSGAIPLAFVQFVNVVFWLVMGSILLFGNFWQKRAK